MVYTNPDMRRRYFTGVSKYDSWIASWGAARPECGIWQYGTTRVPGINGDVDGNLTDNDYQRVIRDAGLNRLDAFNTKYDRAIAWAEKNGIADCKSLTIRELISILEILEELDK